MAKGIEVSESLKPLSKEHENILNFCSNIRKGLIDNVDLNRIRNYTDWFKKEYLERHFEMEEKIIFRILGTNVRVKRALANHRRIKRLLSCSCNNEKVLNLLEEELSTYIRFEERILYKELKSIATPSQLAKIEELHDKIEFSKKYWKDKFWIS